MNKSLNLKGYKRIKQKRLTRRLRAAYLIFAKQRDKNIIFQQYVNKNLVLRLARRGKTWRRKNMSIIG
jgi:phage antirepressor YoqD-like protein